ncbi:DNA helicase [Corynebacterium phage CL31]|nr:DNA helicase [Corynebacterium phage CL31]
MQSKTRDHFTPRSYQRYAIDYMQENPEIALMLDMGLGKTVITLTALKNQMFNTFTVVRPLIVAPLKVARDTWPEELDKWEHLEGLRMAVMVGTPKQRMKALHSDADIWVINVQNLHWLVELIGAENWPFDTLILDELSGYKNHQSQRFKDVQRVRSKITRIAGLTGTPTSNGLMDLWAQYKLIDRGTRLGQRIGQFRERYFTPGKRNGHIVYEWKIKSWAEDAIHRQIADITISMEAKDHLEMPPLTVVDRKVKLSTRALATYKDLKKDMVAELEDDLVVADSAAVLSGKLQQLASGAIYVDDEHNWLHIHDAKLEALDDVIEEANGHTVLVAFWFKHELERLQARYPSGRLLDTSDDMADWKAGKIQLGFIHPASAGHGLNLQSGGHIMVWLTTPWSLELVQQTNGRLYRQGQDQPVTIVRILAEDTIDSKVVDALENKNTTQSALIDAVKAELEGLKKDD